MLMSGVRVIVFEWTVCVCVGWVVLLPLLEKREPCGSFEIVNFPLFFLVTIADAFCSPTHTSLPQPMHLKKKPSSQYQTTTKAIAAFDGFCSQVPTSRCFVGTLKVWGRKMVVSCMLIHSIGRFTRRQSVPFRHFLFLPKKYVMICVTIASWWEWSHNRLEHAYAVVSWF